MVSAEELLAHATGFSWDATPDNAGEYSDRWSIDVTRRLQRDGTHLWSIGRDGGDSPVWTREGEWEYQGLPSGRSDEFLARARWTLDEALAEVHNRVLPEYRARIKDDIEARLEDDHG